MLVGQICFTNSLIKVDYYYQVGLQLLMLIIL